MSEDRVWPSRLRWKLRGAWQAPAFVLFTVAVVATRAPMLDQHGLHIGAHVSNTDLAEHEQLGRRDAEPGLRPPTSSVFGSVMVASHAAAVTASATVAVLFFARVPLRPGWRLRNRAPATPRRAGTENTPVAQSFS